MKVRADWRDDAACLHADPDLFFPVGTSGPTLDQVEEAKRICGACPVRRQCLAWALELGAVSGVWGGSTEDERLPMRKAAIVIPRARQHRSGKTNRSWT